MDDRTVAGSHPGSAGGDPAEIHDFLNSTGWHKRVEEARTKRERVLAGREPRELIAPTLPARRKGAGIDRLPILEPAQAMGARAFKTKRLDRADPAAPPPEAALVAPATELAQSLAPQGAAPPSPAPGRTLMIFALGLAAGAGLAIAVLLIPAI